MKTHPLAALVAILLLTGGSAAVAADAGDVPAPVAMEELANRLALTQEQQQRIAPYLAKRNEELRALSGKSGPDASRREKLRVLREAQSIQKQFVDKVSPVLSKEQQAQWQEIRDESREQLKQRRQHRQ